jgi:hypothetical protein
MLSITKDGVGGGSVHGPGISCGTDCSQSHDEGTQVTLMALPQVGSQFDGWSGGGCSGTGNCVVTLNADVNVTAIFSPAPVVTYTINASEGIGGNISPAGETVSVAGSTVSYTITPEAGYHIADVLIDGASEGVQNSFDFVDISANHTIEARFETDRALSSLIEVGEAAVNHNWQRVTFNKIFVDPVVVAKPASHNDIDPAVVRLRNVDTTGFEVRVQEWDYQDGQHAEEYITYIVMEKGTYVLPGGALIAAGQFETSQVSDFGTLAFGRAFNVAPVIAASVMTTNEDDAVVGRLKNITVTGVDYRLQEQEANDELHGVETIGYIAWEPSMGALDGLVFEVGKSAEIVSHSFTTLSFDAPHQTIPVMIADMQTANDDDPANLRWRNKSVENADIQVAEEQSADADIAHNPEVVGYLLFSGSVTTLIADTDGDGLPDSYENQYDFLDPLISSDAQRDQDGDRVSNLEEYLLGTAPDDDPDTDGDGLSDEYERDNGLDPQDSGDCPSWICSRSYRGWRYAIPN